MTGDHRPVDVGILVHDLPATDNIVSAARRIELAGFDSVWTGDHILSSVDGLVAATALGAATSTIKIGTSVYLPHLRPAYAVGRMLATLNAAGLGPRFTFGVGIGGDIPAEFEVMDLSVRKRGKLLDESLGRLKTMFSESGQEFRGHGTLPTIWVGGRSEAAVHRAIAVGSGFMPYLVSLERFAALGRDLPPLAADGSPFAFALNTVIALDSDAGSGRDLARAARPFGLPDSQLDKYLICGSPAECAIRLGEYIHAGATHLILNVAVPAAQKAAHIDLIATELVPLIPEHLS